MPHIHTTVVSSSHFQLIVIRALKAYKERTKKDLFAHPIAAQLRACNSPGAILFVLQQQVQAHNRSQYSHERLTNRLDRTVNVLYAFCRALGLVCFRTWFWSWSHLHIYLTGYPTCKPDFCRSWYPPFSMYCHPLHLQMAIWHPHLRRLGMFTQVTILSLTSLSVSSTSFGVSNSIRRYHRPTKWRI